MVRRWVCVGRERGWCGRMHLDFKTAYACRWKDREWCEKRDTRSDRVVFRVEANSNEEVNTIVKILVEGGGSRESVREARKRGEVLTEV